MSVMQSHTTLGHELLRSSEKMYPGAIALVIEVSDKVRLRPKVLLILDEDKNPVPEQVLDLSLMQEDDQGNLFVIRRIVKADDYQINAAKYYQEGALQKGFAAGGG